MEIINVTKEDIPRLKETIKTKTIELRALLEQEQTKEPGQLKDKTYAIFQSTKNEILSTIQILDQLGYRGMENTIRKISKNGPFLELSDVDRDSPAMIQWDKNIKQSQDISQQRKDLNWNEIDKRHSTI